MEVADERCSPLRGNSGWRREVGDERLISPYAGIRGMGREVGAAYGIRYLMMEVKATALPRMRARFMSSAQRIRGR